MASKKVFSREMKFRIYQIVDTDIYYNKDLRNVFMLSIPAEARRGRVQEAVPLHFDTPRGVSLGSDLSSPPSISPLERLSSLGYYGRRLTLFRAALLAGCSNGFYRKFQ